MPASSPPPPNAPHDALSPTAPETTRLAPSPTGALHLGNARTFLVNWALARANHWSIVLRIEDLDGPRIKPGAAEDAIRTLEWLGIDWDVGPLVQSDDLEPYAQAMRTLASKAMVFPSALSRKEIEESGSAPHAPDPDSAPGAESRFPPDLRPALRPIEFHPGAHADASGRPAGWRFVTPDQDVPFHDDVAGPQSFNPHRSVGDFVVWTRADQPAYQLAVVVDDHRQGVTRVVRASDLLDSTARQLLLYRALFYVPEPVHTHLPLVVGPDARRLAKRHGDTRIDHYRERKVPPQRLIGLLASWCGIVDPASPGTPRPMDAAEFAARLDLATIPPTPIVFSPKDDQWLVQR
jgi:glutamyl-tRNA synthetase